MKTHFLAAAAVVLAAGSVAAAQSLTTLPPNNGSGGIFMNLTPVSSNLQVTAFDVAYTGTVGTPVQVQVWTRPGTYVGFDSSNVGWTLTQTVEATRGGTSVWMPLPLSVPLDIPAGAPTAVYLQCITTGGGIRYQGTGTTATTEFSNADLMLFSNVARTGDVPFGGTRFEPRAFSGVVYYQIGGGTCYPNCDGSSVEPILNIDDFTCFINEFASAQSLPHEQQVTHYSNCDQSTVAPVLNIDDFTCFINAFAQGCS